jgi:histidine triad (HIT) family protein
MKGDCIFCAIAASDAPAHRVVEDDETVAFLDINPVTRGHTLVVPRAHAEGVWDLASDDAAAVMRTGWQVALMIGNTLRPEGLNLFQATGAIAGQTVFHFHLHVLPRYGPGEIEVSLARRPGDPTGLASVAAIIRGE